MSVNTRSLLRHLVPGKIEKESALITGALLGFLGTDGQALRYELITKQSSLARSGMSVNKRERYVMAIDRAS